LSLEPTDARMNSSMNINPCRTNLWLEMKRVAPLLADHLTEDVFRTPSPLWSAAFAKDNGLPPFFASLNALLNRDETYASKDKEEVTTLFRIFIYLYIYRLTK
jgi:hypothetical protein